MFDEFKNAFNRYNNSHVQLIIINVVIYLVLAVFMVTLTIANVPDFFQVIFRQLALPVQFGAFIQKPWTIITHAFVHDMSSIFHIFFNMLVFYWFGKIFIEYLGSDKLIAVYVLGALAGATVLLLTHNTIPYYIARSGGIAFGASAAVNAVVVATATLLPEYTVFLMFLGPVRIKYIAIFYVIAAFIGTVGSNPGGDVAHLGGALMGFVYIKQLQAGVDWGAWVTASLEWIKGIFQPSSKVKVSYRKTGAESSAKKSSSSSSSAKAAGKASQEEIDNILDKISDKGYESLSKEEKEKLFNASKK